MKSMLKQALSAIGISFILLWSSISYPAEEVSSEWKEEYAYTLGMQAYIFGYSWVFLPKIKYQWVCDKLSLSFLTG